MTEKSATAIEDKLLDIIPNIEQKFVELLSKLEEAGGELAPQVIEAGLFAVRFMGAMHVIGGILLLVVSGLFCRLSWKFCKAVSAASHNEEGMYVFGTGVCGIACVGFAIGGLVNTLDWGNWLAIASPEAALVYRFFLS